MLESRHPKGSGKATLTMDPQMKPARDRRLKLLLCSGEPKETACLVIRVVSPLRRDSLMEIRHAQLESIREQVAWADAILIQRNFPSSALRKRRMLRRVYASGKPILYETDDNLLKISPDNPHFADHKDGWPFLRRALRRAHALIVSTPRLASELGGFKPCIVVPNLLDDALWMPHPVSVPKEPVVIGFAGTMTHGEDLRLCLPALLKLAEEHGDGVCFVFMGCILPELEALSNVQFIPFDADYATYVQTIRTMGIQIGIAPLVDSEFNRAKSAIKWMEMSMCGIAGVYADLDPYRDVVRSGETGLLAGQDWMQWYAALDLLVRDPDLRCRIASRAQAEVIESHTLTAKGALFPQVIRNLVSNLENAPRDFSGGFWQRVLNFFWL